ncbi:MAG: HAD family hydrolase [Chloroflexota bacterium]|nr:HAD family hydrolase [Chloroflexota bacterium]
MSRSAVDRPGDLEIARRHAPVIYFDLAEPFLPDLVGYAVIRQPGPSPTFDRYLDLRIPSGDRAAAVIEYGLWYDWDIQHLYELEHAWAYLDAAGELIHAEGSWHGEPIPLVHERRVSAEGARPMAFAQPGKHALSAEPALFSGHDGYRELVRREADERAGGGLLAGPLLAGAVRTTARRNGLTRAYLHTRAFAPTFRFERRWDGAATPLVPVEELIEAVPERIRAGLGRLETERARRRIWAVLLDLGDTLMVEMSEVKDPTGTTQRADLFPGAAELVRWLRRSGYLVGLVADTRPGTARNVLRQHGIHEAFDTFVISEDLGTNKPDPAMFLAALRAFGLRRSDADRVVMVGNRLDRDVRGANELGLVSVLVRNNERYPGEPSDPREEPSHTIGPIAELAAVLNRLG